MASRRTASLFERILRTNNAHLRNGFNAAKQGLPQGARNPRLLLLIPATGVLRSLTFFSKKQEPAAVEVKLTEEEIQANQIKAIIAKADALYDSQSYAELLVYLKENDVEDDEVLWRLARALTDNSKLTEDKAQAKKLTFEAFDAIKRALALNDNNFACHKWYAILIDRTAQYEGTKARINNAFVCKEHFMKASALNPDDATTLYTLGVWCFLFADMAWYERKIASVVFASPPTSTYEEALAYFHKAEEKEPNFYSKNLMYLGKTYSRTNNKKLAMLYLTRALEFPVKTPDDRDAHKEAAELLKKLGVKVED